MLKQFTEMRLVRGCSSQHPQCTEGPRVFLCIGQKVTLEFSCTVSIVLSLTLLFSTVGSTEMLVGTPTVNSL